MSRSYKKTPICKDGSVWHKRQANRKVRRYSRGISNGMSYKKLYEQYDICDWKWFGNLQEDLHQCKCWEFEYGWKFDEKKEIKKWKKFHYWK